MKIIVTGDREWDNAKLMEYVLKGFHENSPITSIVQGGANRGADFLAKHFCADKLSKASIAVKAEWAKDGGIGAGFIRNQKILKEHPDAEIVIIFHSFLGHSKLSKHLMELALEEDFPVLLIWEEEDDHFCSMFYVKGQKVMGDRKKYE